MLDNVHTNSMEIESNTYNDLQNDLQNDFGIGSFIKDQLVPNAVLYYLNEIDNNSQVKEILRPPSKM